MFSLPSNNVLLFVYTLAEYPKIVAEAKLLADEIGTDFTWNDISFRDATKEDEERIQSALDSEEALPGNGDWAVKLGINLFYSANLSRSSLYSKQMPYNSVIYNAFGRSSPATSPTKYSFGRRSSRQRKVVVGKWCGKVWMSNQVHPFLAQKDNEEQEQERNLCAWATPDENHERKPESTRKRRMPADSRSRKKTKCIHDEGAHSDDSLDNDISIWGRSKHARFMGSEDAGQNDSPEDHLQKNSISRQKKAVCEESEARVSNVLTKSNPIKQYSRMRKGQQSKSIATECAVSDDLPENGSLKQYRRMRRTKPAKNFGEEEVSDSLLRNGNQVRRILRNKQTRCIEREDATSDDSLEDSLRQLQHKQLLKNNKAKLLEKADGYSDDSLEDDSHQLQHRKIPISKPTELANREDAISDDSQDDNSSQSPRRLLESKQFKWVGGDTLSSDSSEDQRISKSKQAQWVDREDSVSDDFHEDNYGLRHRNILGSKLAKSIERDDSSPNESLEEDTQQHRRIPGNRKERENAASDDSMEDNSHQQHNRILRNKRVKTVQTKKQETFWNSRFGKSSSTKQRTPQMKQGSSRQVKQVTSRQRNVKTEQNAGQLDLFAEAEQEGGPSTRLRKRVPKPSKEVVETVAKPKDKILSRSKKPKNASAGRASGMKIKNEDAEYQCDMDGCTMGFSSKHELAMHKRNVCPVKGCGKKFFSHKYLVQHRRVHLDERPLKCPWKGCSMTFKWAWARTEHMRVHTGARPYVCNEVGCGQTFRFVSDFSRHKRKTGHISKKARE